MHFEVSKYEDFDGNLGFKNRSTELEICSSARKIWANSHQKDIPKIGISSKYSWIQTNAETATVLRLSQNCHSVTPLTTTRVCDQSLQMPRSTFQAVSGQSDLKNRFPSSKNFPRSHQHLQISRFKRS